ncbi:hypothetical protein JTB14_007832 [Gonioctena quinquepunctata]|nr:hypothetical protein JTB14_007832 [Gonioctena quinquepunctata]
MSLTEIDRQNMQDFFKSFFLCEGIDEQEAENKLKTIDKITRSFEKSFIGIIQQATMLAQLLVSHEIISEYQTDVLYEEFVKLKLKEFAKEDSDFVLRTISKLALYIFFKRDTLCQVFDWGNFSEDVKLFSKNIHQNAI